MVHNKKFGAEVIVLFRPNSEVITTADIQPAWVGTVELRTAKLAGEGILPRIDSDPVSLNCLETP